MAQSHYQSAGVSPISPVGPSFDSFKPHSAPLNGQVNLVEIKDESSTSRPEKSQGVHIIRSLILEILCLILATASLLCIVALLRHQNNKQIPNWSLGRWGVTLNTVISIISVVFRASLLEPVAASISQFCWTRYTQSRPLDDVCYYDAASRGPLGSLKLLFRLRFMHVSSIAAVITMTALALGPFFQQTVSYAYQAAPDLSNGPALSVASYTYDLNVSISGEWSQSYAALPYNVKSAIYSGVLAPNVVSLPDPPYSCPTGNCTWNSFSSLAVSLKCVDITSHVKLNCSAASSDDDTYCNLIAPQDAPLSRTLDGLSSNTQALNIRTALAREYTSLLKPDGPYANMTGLIAVTEWAKVTSSSPTEVFVLPNSTFEAKRCFFYVSVQDINAQVSDGSYSEEIVREHTQSEIIPQNVENGINYPFMDAFNSNYSLLYKPPFAKTSVNRNDTFFVGYPTWASLASELVHLLEGNAYRLPYKPLLASSDIAELLCQADNITQSMYNLANSLTTVMRSDPLKLYTSYLPVNQTVSGTVTGTVWTQRQFVTVRWAWLALPVILLVLAIIVFVAAIVETHSSRVGLWLSSPLTLFFHGRRTDRSADDHWETESLMTAEKMQNAAKDMRARFTDGEKRTIGVYPKDHVQ